MRIPILLVMVAACTTSNHPCDQGAALPPCTDCQAGDVQAGWFSCTAGESFMTPQGQLANVVGGNIDILDDRLSRVRSVAAGSYVLSAAFDTDGTAAVLLHAGNPLSVTLFAPTGAKVWSVNGGDAALSVTGTIAIGPSRVFATTTVGTVDTQGYTSYTSTLTAYDRATGALVWTRSDLVTATVVAAPSGGAIVAATTSATAGFVMAIDDAGQTTWTTPLSAGYLEARLLARDPGGALGFAIAWTGTSAKLGTVTLASSSSISTKVAFAMVDAGGTVLWARNDVDDTYAGAINSVIVVGDQLAVGSSTGLDGVLELASATGSTLVATASGEGIHDIKAIGTPDSTSLLVSIGSFTNSDDYDHNAYDSQPPPPTLMFDGVELHGDGIALARLAL
jgi:hypothetical protein